MCEPTNEPSHERGELLEAWRVSEDVAMHFNNLLLGFRLKAIGGIALGAVAGVGLKLGDFAHPQIAFWIFFALLIIWLLVWAADFYYYYRLLAGAVDELLRLESALGNIHLSHLIERRVQGEGRPDGNSKALMSYVAKHPKERPSWPIWIFYSLPAVLLFGATLYVGLTQCIEPAERVDTPTLAPDAGATPRATAPKTE